MPDDAAFPTQVDRAWPAGLTGAAGMAHPETHAQAEDERGRSQYQREPR